MDFSSVVKAFSMISFLMYPARSFLSPSTPYQSSIAISNLPLDGSGITSPQTGHLD